MHQIIHIYSKTIKYILIDYQSNIILVMNINLKDIFKKPKLQELVQERMPARKSDGSVFVGKQSFFKEFSKISE